MAASLIKAGHSVTAWNRSPQATAALASQGASMARTAKEAAGAADFVIAMLRDDEASCQVWLNPEDGALAGIRSSSIAIESSTLTPYWVRELARVMTESNVAFLEVPVSGARSQAEAGQLVYHVGGDEATLNRARPVLRALALAINHVGPAGHGALVKLSANALLGIQSAALAEIIAMLREQWHSTGDGIGAVFRARLVIPPVIRALLNWRSSG
ncbi:NAD(P)-dependent oxidoreductase [Stenotrophomonas maltophilia]|uniref:NAD(P)-dependent oxidoreductase n=1 Tax=Stenotrophomonas maltophilia TaxID=40324 RepID=UPI0039C0508C